MAKVLRLFACMLSLALFLSLAPAGYSLAGAADEAACETAAFEPSPGAAQNGAPGAASGTSEKKLLPLHEINERVAEYGSMTIEGMKPEDYDASQSLVWTPLNTAGEPRPIDINLSEPMNFSVFEERMRNLDKYAGVEVSVIGKSAMGRNIYMVKVAPGGEEGKPIIMLSGNVHAREFAGADYLTKILNDTVRKSQTDPKTRSLLDKVVIVAVPLVNPDGREMIINGGNRNRKSNANGVDLNRAMPSANAGQLSKGVKRVKNFSTKPGLYFFAGYNLGSESETRAMIKWFDYYVPKAFVYIDLHQQGGSQYYNKPFSSAKSDSLSKDFAKRINLLLKKGYRLVSESKYFGLNGDGGTMTDYARSVAEGFRYSYAYGRLTLGIDGEETPLVVFKDIDDRMQYYNPANASFRAVTIEIGRSPSYLGAGSRARALRKREYKKYGWDGFLTGVIGNVLALQPQ